MPLRLTCPLGHAWEVQDGLAGQPARCPVCGVSVATSTEPGSATTAAGEDVGLTVLHPKGWQPLSNPSLEAPPALPDFEIVGELGRGGMGIVYKARWRSQNRVVALKVIRKDRLQHDEAVRRFRREAQAAARLHHPNVVSVFDSDHSGDTHYLVMEFVDGVTLERLIEQQGPLSVAQACDFMRQAAHGLQHAHEQALVHRDIKPSNLMITPPPSGNGGDSRALVKILDMGVARLLQLAAGPIPGESFSTLTQGGAVIGTADYIAPEQLEDPHGADIRADLYSLGCTFYYLLTGQVPFPGGSLISKLDKQRWQVPTSVDELRVEIPAAVASVVRKLLAKKPADRFASPAELAHTLDELVRSGFSDTGTARLAIRVRRRLPGHTDSVSAAAFAPDGGRAVSGGKDRVVLLWDVASGELVRSFAKQTQEIRALALAAQCDRVAWAAGVAVRVAEVATGLEVRRLGGHTDAVRAVAFTADGVRLVSASEDRTVRLWDLHTGREIQRMLRHRAGVTCCAVEAGAARALSGSRDQTLRLWDLRNGQELGVMTPSAGTVLDVALSPSGQLAASAHFDTLVRLWDVESGRELRRFQGHKQMVTAVSFTHDGRYLLTGSQDHTVRLWQVDTGLELASATLTAGVAALAVSPDGSLVLAGGGAGDLSLFELPLG